MAYGDYGAYVWKNGKLKLGWCDTCWAYREIGNEFGWIRTEDDEEDIILSHAVVPVGKTLFEFYKYGLKIYWGHDDGTITTEVVDVEKDILNRAKVFIGDGEFELTGYMMDADESVIKYEIGHGEDAYCVIVGSSFGKGYDHYKKSKIVRKRIVFDEKFKYYLFDFKSIYQFDYCCRMDDVAFERHLLWEFGVKPFIKDLFTFRFRCMLYHGGQIIEHARNIRYMK